MESDVRVQFLSPQPPVVPDVLGVRALLIKEQDREVTNCGPINSGTQRFINLERTYFLLLGVTAKQQQV